MISDLLVLASAVDRETALSVVPPTCRRGIELAPPALVQGAEALIEAPEWTPRRPVRHLLPSLSLLTSRDDHTYRFEVSARVAGAWTPWVATTALGPGAFAPLAPATGALSADVDVLASVAPVDRVRLRLRLAGPALSDLLGQPWLLTLSACDLEGAPTPAPVGHDPEAEATPAPGARGPRPRAGYDAASAAGLGTGAGDHGPVTLAVPAASQMEEPEATRRRVCSPTCVAMVLRYWGVTVPVAEVAASIFHAGLDLYGVWPAAIRAAARRGVLGYLLRFPDWDTAAWCLDRGLPVIASVRYGEGELDGTAMPSTSGHLVVLRGHDGPWVLVNDPAAATAATVPRRYRRDQLERAWLGRSGVGYVLFAPGG